MYCIKCGTKMIVGTAIKPKIQYGRGFASLNHTIKSKDLKIILCDKCPNCGHSEEIETTEEHYSELEK